MGHTNIFLGTEEWGIHIPVLSRVYPHTKRAFKALLLLSCKFCTPTSLFPCFSRLKCLIFKVKSNLGFLKKMEQELFRWIYPEEFITYFFFLSLKTGLADLLLWEASSVPLFSLFNLVCIPNRILSLSFMCVCVCLVFIYICLVCSLLFGFFPLASSTQVLFY